jgi:hypothetical protein
MSCGAVIWRFQNVPLANRGRLCIASAEGRFELPTTWTRTLRQNLRQT